MTCSPSAARCIRTNRPSPTANRHSRFANFEHGATRLAHRLAAAGVERGARVVVFGAKLAVMPVTAVAAWKLNAVYVPLDGSMPIARARALLDRIQPRAVISLDGTVDVGAYCADARIPGSASLTCSGC